jgi:hypothetical protein
MYSIYSDTIEIQLNQSVARVEKRVRILFAFNIGFLSVYFCKSTFHNYISERTASNVVLNSKGIVEVTSEGEIGALCGSVDKAVGTILCKSLGLGYLTN